MKTYDEAVQAYQWVKESIKYASPPHWGSPEQTLRDKRGHCGMKSEVLVAMLRARGFKARLVEGRAMHLQNTFTQRLILWLGLVLYDVHFWVEAFVNDEWLALDPTPDSGIIHLTGDTEPGTHLGSPEYTYRWDEIPKWFKDTYNMKLSLPLRFTADIEIALRRFIGRWQRTKK